MAWAGICADVQYPADPGARMELDHIVIAAELLEDGRAWAEHMLGAELVTGGEHAALGTHNCLLSLGPETYLEVIAIDPRGTQPAFARCFGLDAFTGPPRLVAWMARVENLTQALLSAPAGAGRIRALTRGDLHWLMAVPESGYSPYDGTYPGLIEWQSAPLPPQRLPDRGVRLERLTLSHPDADALETALDGFEDPRVHFRKATQPGISASLRRATGNIALL